MFQMIYGDTSCGQAPDAEELSTSVDSRQEVSTNVDSRISDVSSFSENPCRALSRVQRLERQLEFERQIESIALELSAAQEKLLILSRRRAEACKAEIDKDLDCTDNDNNSCWYIVDAKWKQEMYAWISSGGMSPDPGPVSNMRLYEVDEKGFFSLRKQLLRRPKFRQADYSVVSATYWWLIRFFFDCDTSIVRKTRLIYSAPGAEPLFPPQGIFQEKWASVDAWKLARAPADTIQKRLDTARLTLDQFLRETDSCLDLELSSLLCTLCMERKREVAYIECGHMVACQQCAARWKLECPVCKTAGKLLRIFL